MKAQRKYNQTLTTASHEPAPTVEPRQNIIKNTHTKKKKKKKKKKKSHPSSYICACLLSLRGRNLAAIPPGIEPLAGLELFQGTSAPFAADIGLFVAPPFQLNLGPLNAKEHDCPRNRNPRGKRRRQDKVVLGPKCQIARPDIHPRQQRNRDRRHRVAEGVRRPRERAIPKGHGVELAQVAVLGEFLNEQECGTGEDDSGGETQEEFLVLTLVSKDLERANRAPEYGCCEKCIGPGTVEAHRCVLLADVGDVDLEVDDGRADKGGDEGGDHLGGKGMPGGDLRPMLEKLR